MGVWEGNRQPGTELLQWRCAVYPLRLMMREHGERLFGAGVAWLRREQCGKPPAPVYLCADHREGGSLGSPPGWSIEPVPAER